jgi:FlaA1/EpsC-like NDP-sugar epimerase
MSSSPDTYIAEVVVVLEELTDERTAEVVRELEARGLAVDHVNHANSVIEGRVEVHRAHELEQVPSVRYVRKHFTYAAEFPPGHPMDRNKQ